MIDLYQELRSVIEALERSSLPYALVGGLAVSIYTEPRATQDIDLVINVENWEQVLTVLAPLGYELLATPITFDSGRLEIRRLTKLADDEFMVIDFLILHDETLQGILERCLEVNWKGQPLRLAAVDDLALLKKRRGGKQDIADLEKLGIPSEEEAG